MFSQSEIRQDDATTDRDPPPKTAPFPVHTVFTIPNSRNLGAAAINELTDQFLAAADFNPLLDPILEVGFDDTFDDEEAARDANSRILPLPSSGTYMVMRQKGAE